ncbi:hypothetical protein CLF_102412 [Clonorchis sinensis]|uniref:Uncharacterized protein n=1 Tax=Clonorchis sinensis TaxID=79923 RepID=G7Y7V8_CLOSI|nr:hypothetical protein CLF_102412 [Clonorchis sinensis]
MVVGLFAELGSLIANVSQTKKQGTAGSRINKGHKPERREVNDRGHPNIDQNTRARKARPTTHVVIDQSGHGITEQPMKLTDRTTNRDRRSTPANNMHINTHATLLNAHSRGAKYRIHKPRSKELLGVGSTKLTSRNPERQGNCEQVPSTFHHQMSCIQFLAQFCWTFFKTVPVERIKDAEKAARFLVCALRRIKLPSLSHINYKPFVKISVGHPDSSKIPRMNHYVDKMDPSKHSKSMGTQKLIIRSKAQLTQENPSVVTDNGTSNETTRRAVKCHTLYGPHTISYRRQFTRCYVHKFRIVAVIRNRTSVGDLAVEKFYYGECTQQKDLGFFGISEPVLSLGSIHETTSSPHNDVRIPVYKWSFNCSLVDDIVKRTKIRIHVFVNRLRTLVRVGWCRISRIKAIRKSSMAGNVGSSRHPGIDPVKIRLENETLEKEITIELGELEIGKRRLVSLEKIPFDCEPYADERMSKNRLQKSTGKKRNAHDHLQFCVDNVSRGQVLNRGPHVDHYATELDTYSPK